jgi:hypothetical protein
MKAPVLFLFASAGFAASLCAQDFQIPPAREPAEGGEYRVAVSASTLEEVEFTQGGTVVKQARNEFTVDCRAVERVLEWTHDHATLSILIDKLAKQENGVVMEMLPPNSIVNVVFPHKKPEFMQNGRPVSKVLGDVLIAALPMSIYGKKEEICFGAKERKKVGDSWPFEPLWAPLMGYGDGNQSKGTSTLEAIEHGKGGDVFVLEVHGEVNSAPPVPGFVSMPLSWEETAEINGAGHKDDAKGRIDYSLHMKHSKTQTLAGQ